MADRRRVRCLAAENVPDIDRWDFLVDAVRLRSRVDARVKQPEHEAKAWSLLRRYMHGAWGRHIRRQTAVWLNEEKDWKV